MMGVRGLSMACYSSEVCLPTSGAAHARGNAQFKRTPLFCRSKPARSTCSRPRARGYGSLVVQSELAPTLRSLGMADAGECGGALPVSVFQASCDAHLQAACNLRARTFYSFIRKTYRLGEHQQYLSMIEFEALKEKIEGKRPGYGKVCCVLATVLLSDVVDLKDELRLCKLNGQIDEVLEDQLVVGSLDLNQTAKLPDEMSGSHPEGNEAQHRRGYLSNVCVAKELQRKGVGTNLIKHTKRLALLQGISDLYTHVAIGNESAERLYEKSGFIKEKEEKASEARLMGRPPRLLLWMDLTKSSKNC